MLSCALAGLRQPGTDAHGTLLLNQLVPLYRLSGAVEESDGGPPASVLAPCAPSLGRCVVTLVSRGPGRAVLAVDGIAAAFSACPRSAAPRLLLLSALRKVLCCAPGADGPAALQRALPTLASAAGDELAAVAASAAALCTDLQLTDAFASCGAAAVDALLPALLGAGEPHWSIEVRAARHGALCALRSVSEDAFSSACDTVAAPRGETVDALLARLAPPVDESARASEAAEALSLSATPQPLPERVGLNDLVFGHLLGEGSSGTVHAAKVRQKGVAASAWRDVAVKRLRADALFDRTARDAAAREIAALRAVSHPGVTRLVAAFTVRWDVFLVLEYAAGGDLHSRITTLGCLDAVATRFLVGELVAALCAVHKAGLSFGDLKPENVLLTASGHAKLADFGAARPLQGSAAGEAAAGKAARACALRSLRSGDWRTQAGLAPAQQPQGGWMEDEDELSTDEAEEQLEGTPAYLSPELVSGGLPSAASDAWALGVVTHQCLTGTLPLWAEEQGELLRLIAAWPGPQPGFLPASVPAEACEFVSALMSPDPGLRLGGGGEGLRAAANHPWLRGLDIDALHTVTPPPMARGASAPPRRVGHVPGRLNSVMWSRARGAGGSLLGGEEPVAGADGGVIPETDAEVGAPWTGPAPGSSRAATTGAASLPSGRPPLRRSPLGALREEG